MFASLLAGVLVSSVHAEPAHPLVTGLAPHPEGLFASLRADPRELHFAMRLALPQDNKTVAEVAIGHYYGIYRWALPKDAGYMQLNIGGGIFPRFIFPDDKALQVIDFYGNLPIDIRVGKWSGRFMFYHVSSHLGDDYIKSSGRFGERNSWNSLRSIVSYDFNLLFRLYAGYTYHILVEPAEQKLGAFQAGFEIYSKPFLEGRAQAYWATDIQGWDRRAWRGMFNSQIGVKTGRDATKGRGISYFAEFTAGPKYYGQFFQEDETRAGLGVKFDIN